MAKRIPTRLSGQPMTVSVTVRVRDVWAVRVTDAKGKKTPLKDVTLARWNVYGVTAREAFEVFDKAAQTLAVTAALKASDPRWTPPARKRPTLPTWADSEVEETIEKLERIEKQGDV